MGFLVGLVVQIVLAAVSAAVQLAVLLLTLLVRLLMLLIPHLLSAIGGIFRLVGRLLSSAANGIFRTTKSAAADLSREGDPLETRERPERWAKPRTDRARRPRRTPKTYW